MMCICRNDEAEAASQKQMEDQQGGYVSSDGNGTVHRCGCFFCGIDLRQHTKTKSKSRPRFLDGSVQTEKKSVVTQPFRASLPPSVHQPLMPQFPAFSGTDGGRRCRSLLKTNPAARLASGPPEKQHDSGDRRHRAFPSRVGGGRTVPEPISLSHYYRRHHHRTRNHSRAMRQVAEWIENIGVAGTAADQMVVMPHRRHRARRHVHEHQHHHYHYHYSASGLV